MPLIFSSQTLIAGLGHGVRCVTSWFGVAGIRSSFLGSSSRRARAHGFDSIKLSSKPGSAYSGWSRLATRHRVFAGHEHGAAFIGRGLPALCLLLLVAWLTLGLYETARAAPGFSGLDRDTLETLKRSDQRGKHPGLQAQPDEREPPRRHEPRLSSSQAAEIARQREGGRVLNVVLEHDSGEPYYRVKILERGRVQVVHIDAR